MQTNREKNVFLHIYFIDNCFHFSTFAGNLIATLRTAATVELHENRAILSKDGKRFCIKLLSPATPHFRSYPAPFAGVIKKTLQGYTLLEALCQSATGDVNIRIRVYSLK